MRKHTLIAMTTILVLTLATIAMAADPFVGTWQRVQSKTGDNNQSQLNQLILTPVSDGISIQQGASKPDIAHYGKDSLFQGGATWNIVRVNDHNLKTTASQDGKIAINETATVSSDGKHYTRSQELVGNAGRFTIEYDRVGPVPAGDAFFGTWQRSKETSPLTYTIKVDGDMFDLTRSGGATGGGRGKITVKLDGKESRGADGETNQAKRIDANTIEIIQKFAMGTNTFESKTLYQANGNSLTVTTETSSRGVYGKPSRNVTHFKRAK